MALAGEFEDDAVVNKTIGHCACRHCVGEDLRQSGNARLVVMPMLPRSYRLAMT